MDYKELIEKLMSGHYGGPKFEERAATAIETLLEERDAAVEDLRKVAKCDSCKWCHSDASACKGCGMFYKKWECRGPQKESGNNGQA